MTSDNDTAGAAVITNAGIVGDIWVAGGAWHVTSHGLESADGDCSIPAALVTDETLAWVAQAMPTAALAEFVSAFNFMMVLHGRCSGVRGDVVRQLLVERFGYVVKPPPPPEGLH